LPYAEIGSTEIRKRVVSAARGAGTARVSKDHLFEIYAAFGDIPQKIFGGSEPSVGTLQEYYRDDPAFAAYMTARFALTDEQTSFDKQEYKPQEMLKLALTHLPKITHEWAHSVIESYINRVQGTMELEAGQWYNSQSWFVRSIESMPTQATSLYLLGMAALKLNDTDRACDLLSKSLLLDPDYKATHVNLGAVFLRQQRYAEAILVSQILLKRFPETRPSQYHLGVACYQQAVILQDQIQDFYLTDEFAELRQCAYDMLLKSYDSKPGERRTWLQEDEDMLAALKGYFGSLRLRSEGCKLPPVPVTQAAVWIKNHWRT